MVTHIFISAPSVTDAFREFLIWNEFHQGYSWLFVPSIERRGRTCGLQSIRPAHPAQPQTLDTTRIWSV